MKRWVIVLLILVILAGLVGGGWAWARGSPEQARQFLIDRGLGAAQADQVVAWTGAQPAGDAAPGPLVASGSIEGDEVAIVSEFAGQIARLSVREGDEVKAGEVLVQLDTSVLLAQAAQAKAAVAAAQANLDNVRAGTHPAEILAAEAAVEQAMAQRDAAHQAWQDTQAILDNPQDIDAQIAQARAYADVAAVQIEQAQAKIKAAEVERDQYQAQGSLEEKGLYRVYQYQVEAAQAALETARTNQAGAERTVAQLQALRANPLALVGKVHQAESQYRIAEAGVAVAQAKLAERQAGPTPAQVQMAEAQLAKARAAAATLDVQIAKRTLRSPIDGIVASSAARPGEAAIAGATLLTVASLDEVRLTVYIPENELGRVYLGQAVRVEVDSFPGEGFAGVVSFVSQEAEFTPKNVQTEADRVNMVFAVRITLPNADHRLKPGMPADVVFAGPAGQS